MTGLWQPHAVLRFFVNGAQVRLHGADLYRFYGILGTEFDVPAYLGRAGNTLYITETEESSTNPPHLQLLSQNDGEATLLPGIWTFSKKLFVGNEI